MPQQAQNAVSDTLPADFFEKQGKNAPDTLPADFDFGEGVQKKTAAEAKASAYKSGAIGSWEPETGAQQFVRKHIIAPEKYDESLRRTLGAAGEALKGTLKAPIDVLTAPLRNTQVTPEEKKYGMSQDVGPVGKFGQEIERQMFVPMGEAAGWWKQHLSNPTLRGRLLDDVLSVAQEGIGAGAGTVVGGKVLGSAGAATSKAMEGAYNPYGVKARGIRGIESVESKAGMTPAEETALRVQVDRVLDLEQHGHTIPPVVKKIDSWMKKVSESKTETLPDGSKVEGGAPTGLTFMDVRKFLSALDEKIDWDSMKGTKMEREMKTLRKVADIEAIKTAHKAGLAGEYVKAKKDYARGMKLEASGRKVGGAVGATAGIVAGAEVGKAIGHPFYGAGFGASAGGALGAGLGKRIVKGITEAGLGRENVPSEKIAASELKAERSSSVESAKQFGKGETDVDMILRRTNLPEAEQAKIRQIIQQNEEMRRSRSKPSGGPDAPAPEIMQRAKAEYEQKYGKPKTATEMKAAQDNALKKMDEINREKMRKTSSGGEALRHNDAISQAKKELGPNANISKVLQRADEIERKGRQH